MSFFLEHRIAPVFAVPRKPFSQASIEGNNSVFSRKFWNRIVFHNIQEVDEKLEWFNIASERYTGYTLPQRKENTDFMPKMYFIRQVREEREPSGRAFIDILNDKVFLPSSYINYFVLAEWNLVEEQLSIRFEKEQKSEVIEQIRFPINERSKKYRKGW